ncbi:MAG: transglutaminase family protein [Inquilinus sp.]|nr:transglutaminase family protein [Inquilinus sp.]
MQRLTVKHVTTYRYRQPVGFGPHRLMFRPRDSHDLRLVSAALVINPKAQVRWLHDVFGNSIAIAEFAGQAETLSFESDIEVEVYGAESPVFPLEYYARTYPFGYSNEEIPDLGRTTERHYDDPDRHVDLWARRFVGHSGGTPTADMLAAMTQAIHHGFTYQSRYAIGTQEPTETLRLCTGTCRDLALLMMEAARSLGLAARFVSGYVYDPALDGAEIGMVGGGATHAWVQIYLPGAGWVEFDPTNGKVGGSHLIRVAVTRDPSQAIPLSGSYVGPTDAFLDMDVSVEVRAA